VGVDESSAMLDSPAARFPPQAYARLGGPFDLVVSALAVHHLDGPGKLICSVASRASLCQVSGSVSGASSFLKIRADAVTSIGHPSSS
jgi:hypothetical protein